MADLLRILVSDPQIATGVQIKQGLGGRRATDVVSVGGIAEARALLAENERPFDLLMTEADLPDGNVLDFLRWIRVDQASPRPNLPIIMMSGQVSPSLTAMATAAGVRHVLQKPLASGKLGLTVDDAIAKYPNFVVSPSYIGPDRRATKRPIRADRRITRSNSVHIIDDPNGYALNPEDVIVIFDYLRLRLSAAKPEMFRDFLTRAHLTQAVGNVPLLQERLLAKVTEQHKVLHSEHDALAKGANGDTLKRINKTAHTISLDTTMAGFTLMAAISTSLRHYTSGVYGVSERLIRFLASHLSALRSAISHRIFDDGGAVGKTIVAIVRDAEAVFGGPSASPAGAR